MNTEGVRHFLGMVYCSQFIESVHAWTFNRPYCTVEKVAAMKLGPKARVSIQGLCEALVVTPDVKLPDLNREFVVQVDVSDLGLGRWRFTNPTVHSGLSPMRAGHLMLLGVTTA